MAEPAVAVPEPDLTPEEMVARASALRPQLLACQEECERLRTLPEGTARAFLEAGFYRILQPRRFGGYEFGLDTFTRVMVCEWPAVRHSVQPLDGQPREISDITRVKVSSPNS